MDQTISKTTQQTNPEFCSLIDKSIIKQETQIMQQQSQQALQKKQMEARLYVLKPTQQSIKASKGSKVTSKKKSDSEVRGVGEVRKEGASSDAAQNNKLLKIMMLNKAGSGVNQQQLGGDQDLGEDLGFDEGSPVESDGEWDFKRSGANPEQKIEISQMIGFTDSAIGTLDNRCENPAPQYISGFQDLGSSIDSTPNNDQNEPNYRDPIGVCPSPPPHIIVSQLMTLEKSSTTPTVGLSESQNNQHKTIVQLNYSPKLEANKIKPKAQVQIQGSQIMSHGIVSQQSQKLHQYNQLIQKTSIGGTKQTFLNSQARNINPESSSTQSVRAVISSQEYSASKPQLQSHKKPAGITSSLISKSSILNTSSTGLHSHHKRSHVSPNAIQIQTRPQKNLTTATNQKGHCSRDNELNHQAVITTPFIQQNVIHQAGAQSFLQNSNTKQHFAITPGSVHKSSFNLNNNQSSMSNNQKTPAAANPYLTQGPIAGTSPRPQVATGPNTSSYSTLARQRSQNKLQSSASQPQFLVQPPMIMNSQSTNNLMGKGNQVQNATVNQSMSSGGGSFLNKPNGNQSFQQINAAPVQRIDLVAIDQEWMDFAQPLLDTWRIQLKPKNAFTKFEVLQLIRDFDIQAINPLSSQLKKDNQKISQLEAQNALLDSQLQAQLENQKIVQENILEVRRLFSQHEEILKKMDECQNELKSTMLNSLMCLDFYRDLEQYIGEHRYISQSQDVIATLNEVDTLMQQHGLHSLDFDNQRVQNLIDSIQEYVRTKQLEKKVIEINIGDDFDEKKYTSNNSGDNFIFSPNSLQGQGISYIGEDQKNNGSLQVKITRVGIHTSIKPTLNLKTVNLNQSQLNDTLSQNRSTSNQGSNRHLNGQCCNHGFSTSQKQISLQDELKLKTAIIARLREQLEHKLKKILALKQQLRVEREDTMKLSQVKKLHDSLEKMEHDYNSVVVRNNKQTLELREIKAQMEEGSKEVVRLKNVFKEMSKQNVELRKALEGKEGYKGLEEAVAQMSSIMVSKRNEVLNNSQKEQIKAIFGNSVILQRLKHKIHYQEDQLHKQSSYIINSLRLNFQYKDLIDFLWPLLKLAYKASDLDVLQLKLEQVWKTKDSMETFNAKEIGQRAAYLIDLKRRLVNENILVQSDHSHLPNDLLVLLGQHSDPALRSSQFSKPRNTIHTLSSEEGDSIWAGLKHLKQEFSNVTHISTTNVKQQNSYEDSRLILLRSDQKKVGNLVNTTEALGKKKSIFLLDQQDELGDDHGSEDSMLLKDDDEQLRDFNQLLSPFDEGNGVKKFQFKEGEEDLPIRQTSDPQNIISMVHTTKHQEEQNQRFENQVLQHPSTTLALQHFHQHPLNSTTNDADFTSLAKNLINPGHDLEGEAPSSTYYFQGTSAGYLGGKSASAAKTTSKKILKEKLKRLKYKNSELLSALHEVQSRVTFLEQQRQARDHTLSSDCCQEIANIDDLQYSQDIVVNPQVFKEQKKEIYNKKYQVNKQKKFAGNQASYQQTLELVCEIEEKDVPEILNKEAKIPSQFSIERVDFINMLSLQAEALEEVLRLRKGDQESKETKT